ncbi:hypothetical protein N7478_007071 [Penicillium angulare]|uniref:uncharacterized protein n=1 Tax=Penicillium angulare TaxID=116970 RepID=UPI002541ECB0|nr:uncharacterized protein N7478_007071 [Penicillium angulare]KAJ5281699.1 hypothetical protein N7478_007071 [Penicillium angulare]
MTSDSLSHRPTESLVLPNKRRFFPFRIPNFHSQLRHYISTADPDRIYVVVDRIVYAIHISAQKREGIAVLPFEPRCLAAGHGWIAVGGPDSGECAFIRIDERGLQVHDESSPLHASDVDSALPLDLDLPSGFHSPGTSGSDTGLPPRSGRRTLPELVIHKFGGSIVNSVTIHRFPNNGEGTSHEDVMILSNNDKTVTVYSLTRSKVLKSFIHTTCMNYATVSPDKTILAAVGDENQVYFYRILREWRSTSAEAGRRLARWDWEVLPCIEMDIGMRQEDACCFTIAFSPSSHLCAIGSQSGVITVLDVEVIRKYDGEGFDENAILYQFLASRPCQEGGAVRCLTFSPEPWDLLVWLEGSGRAGVADVRQVFCRRQLLRLDLDDPALQEFHLEPVEDESDGQLMDDDDPILPPPPAPRLRIHGTDSPHERDTGESERSSLRENLAQGLSERERLIMEFLNTARWTSRLEEGLTERPERPARTTVHPHPAARSRQHVATDQTNRNSRATPLQHSYDSPDNMQDGDDDLFLPPPPPPVQRLSHINRSGAPERLYHARRQSSVVLSQGSRSSEAGTSSHDRQPSITVSLTTSPSELQSTSSDIASRVGDPDVASHEDSSTSRAPDAPGSPGAPSLMMDPIMRSEALARLRSPRSSSTPRQTERPQSTTERRYDASRLSAHEIRANLAAERLRRHRLVPSEMHNRASHDREQRHRQQLLGFEQAHSPRWIRNIINDLPDRSLIHANSAIEPDATAGVGWGADGRSLYIATVEGIFEFQLNVHDRRTFPSFSYR